MDPAKIHDVKVEASRLEAGNRVTVDSDNLHTINLDVLGESQGYILDEATLRSKLGLGSDSVLKTAKEDESTVLIPQPSDDLRDPLNWPTRKKHVTLFVACLAGALGDFGSSAGAITLLPQATEWRLEPNTINHATDGNIIMIGAGGLAVVVLSAYFGRLPVFFWFQCLSLGTAIWCAAATSFKSFMTARMLNGAFSIVGAVSGLIFIKDIYFFHEHARRINLWATSAVLAPFVGPLCTALIVQTASWRWAYALLAMLAAIALILTVFFLDETFWRRDDVSMPDQRSRYLRLLGFEQRRTKIMPDTFLSATKRRLIAIVKLPLLLCSVYSFFISAFVIGNNITISVFLVPEYHFNYNQLAAVYSAPVLGTIVGLVGGHWVHDLIAKVYSRRHSGVIIPETRLIVVWFVTPLYILGMNLIGATVQHHWHYMVLAVGWFVHNLATIMLSTGLYAYMLDAYPQGSGEVAAWMNFGRTFGGFVVGYTQIIWAQAEGLGNVYGIQSGIAAAVSLLILVLQLFGPRIRAWQTPMNFEQPGRVMIG